MRGGGPDPKHGVTAWKLTLGHRIKPAGTRKRVALPKVSRGRASLVCVTVVVVMLPPVLPDSCPFASVQDLAAQTNEPVAAPDNQGPPPPLPDDGNSYQVGAFVLQYIKNSPQLPPLDDVMQLEVELGQTTEGYVAPREGVPSVRLRLATVRQRPVKRYYASAVQRIIERIRDFYVERRILAVYVGPDPIQIDDAGNDLRPADQTDLRILITTGIVTELRTLASGERIAPEERINNPLHDRIRAQSPIQPYREGEEAPNHLLRKDLLDRYIFHLDRHPGRRVDASISGAEEPGGVALDYLITENNPWVLYFQLSNTGTRSTERLRERFGLLHTQLTNNDDIFELNFVTANFSRTNAVLASYEALFPGNDRLRWRAHGRWSEFTAADVGAFLGDFTGGDWILGGEIIANIYQDRELFVDLLGGARFLRTHVSSPLAGEGQESFFLPHIGVRFERRTAWMNTTGSLELEFHTEVITDLDPTEPLGRTPLDKEWAVMRWDLNHSVYLEPLLNREAWEDPTTPESSTLAHELAISFRGQHGFDNRLIPNLERPLGGLYTVRGYPESIVAGDTVVLGSIEYRYHVPRALDIRPEPDELFGEPFRLAPQYVYGRPDWDLILKAFLDVGQSIISDPLSFEGDETLVGAGVGIELIYKRNVRARLDLGFALHALESRGVDSGANRLHFLMTLFF